MTTATEKSREQIVDDFKHQLKGERKTLAQWGAERGFTISQVYSVTRGINKGKYGKGREIAELIGLV